MWMMTVLPSFAMFFKVLPNKALVDNWTTTTVYLNNLASLDVHIGVMNSIIEVFNQYVLDNCQALKKRFHDIDKDNMLEHLLDA